MTWQDSIAPASPDGLHTEVKADSLVLTWNPATDDSGHPVRYNLYASRQRTIDTNDPHNLKCTYLYGTRLALPLDEVQGLHFTVTAVDVYGNESPTAQSPRPSHHRHANPVAPLKLPECPSATQMTVKDLYGREVWHGDYDRRLPITDLAPGVYDVILQDKDRHTLRRIRFTR